MKMKSGWTMDKESIRFNTRKSNLFKQNTRNKRHQRKTKNSCKQKINFAKFKSTQERHWRRRLNLLQNKQRCHVGSLRLFIRLDLHVGYVSADYRAKSDGVCHLHVWNFLDRDNTSMKFI